MTNDNLPFPSDTFIELIESGYSFGTSMRIGINHADGSYSAAEPVVVRKLERGEIPPIAATFERPTLQALMDALWNAGFRPGHDGSSGQLAATERHLEDMRALAFAKIKVNKPA